MLRRLPMNHFLTKFWQNKQTPNGRRCVFKHSLRGEALLPGCSMHGPRVAGRPPGGLWVIVICDEV